jgi:tetratricopeptide (TPR) repeat protein
MKTIQKIATKIEVAINITGLTMLSIAAIGIVWGFSSPSVLAQNLPSSAISTKNSNAKDFYDRGLAKTERGDYQGAIADFDRVISIDPQIIEAYCDRGLARIGLQDLNGALADFDLALKIDPLHADAYNRRGNVLAMQGNLQGAVENFSQALQIDPNFVDAYYNRGLALSEHGDLKGAIADYNESIRLEPDFAEAYGNRGFVRDRGNLEGYKQTLSYIQVVQGSKK